MLGGDGRKNNGGARAGAGRKAGLPNSSTLEFRNYVRQYTKEAVDMFVAAMRDEKMDMRFRLEAANWLVERGYHDGTLGAVGGAIRGGLAFGRGSIAPQPCIRWARGPEP